MKLGFEFLSPLILECGLFVTLKAQVDKIPHLKLPFYLTPVCIHLLLNLGSGNVVFECPEYVLILLDPFFCPWSLTCPKHHICK